MHGIFFYQASTVVRLVRAIVEVWGALRDVLSTRSVMPLLHLGKYCRCNNGFKFLFFPLIDNAMLNCTGSQILIISHGHATLQANVCVFRPCPTVSDDLFEGCPSFLCLLFSDPTPMMRSSVSTNDNPFVTRNLVFASTG